MIKVKEFYADAREDFAPYAVAWQRELMEAKDDD